MRQLFKRSGVPRAPTARGRVLGVVTIAVAGIAMMSAVAAWPQSIARPVATVRLHKPEIISSPQFAAHAGMVARQSRLDALDLDQCRAVLDALIDEHLIEQEAAQQRLIPTEAEVDQILVERRRQVEQQLGLESPYTDDGWAAEIQRQFGLTPEEYRERITVLINTERLAAQMRPGRLEEVLLPSEAEIAEYYDLNVPLFAQPKMALVLHVHFRTQGLDEDAVTRARERADQALQELRDGAGFDDLVVKYSDDGNSRFNGGELGNRYLRRDDARGMETLGPEFLRTVFAMQVGETSEVVRSAVGFHILKIADLLPARLLTLDDRVTPRSSQTVRGQITALLATERQARTSQQVVQEVIAELRDRAAVEIFTDNLNATCPTGTS
ncbi:MAG: peptidylprolyl isomerase [Spirochaetaceae bacterium]|nr:peptidylprolyl isomerase [Spirochaetaceae bacterium]